MRKYSCSTCVRDWVPAVASVVFGGGLETALFACADDVIIGTQRNALPDALVKIEDRLC
jgi:hypothetical protein